jgi:hypothetical protein
VLTWLLAPGDDLGGGGLQGEDPAGVAHQGTPGRGEGHALRRPGEQGLAELVLQGADLAAERGLRDQQVLGGAMERATVGHRQEISQMPQFHP